MLPAFYFNDPNCLLIQESWQNQLFWQPVDLVPIELPTSVHGGNIMKDTLQLIRSILEHYYWYQLSCISVR